MQLRQIPQQVSVEIEAPESSESESELDYSDSDTTDPESDDDFDMVIAAVSTEPEEVFDILKLGDSAICILNPVEPYTSLDQCQLFESSSSDSCPSPLTPTLETSPTKPLLTSEAREPMSSNSTIDDVNSGASRPVSTQVQIMCPDTATVSVHRDRSPIVLKKSET